MKRILNSAAEILNSYTEKPVKLSSIGVYKEELLLRSRRNYAPIRGIVLFMKRRKLP